MKDLVETIIISLLATSPLWIPYLICKYIGIDAMLIIVFVAIAFMALELGLSNKPHEGIGRS